MNLFQTDDAAIGLLRPPIRPRSDWAAGLAPTGPLEEETDVQFLLVHHTASRNDYSEAEVADEIRGFYRFHTGAEKGWSDVAYNFFVDRFGEIWEAREGSIERPIKGDATGGSQGFAILCCLIGDYRTAPVSSAQQQSLTLLLAWLSERYGVATKPGSKTTFVSRGSNKWVAGTTVRAATISGHRDMSATSCPGQVVYDLLTQRLPSDVSELRLTAAQGLAPPPDTVSGTTTPPPRVPDERPKLQASRVSTSPEPGFPFGAASGLSAVGLGSVAGLLALRTRRQRSKSRAATKD